MMLKFILSLAGFIVIVFIMLYINVVLFFGAPKNLMYLLLFFILCLLSSIIILRKSRYRFIIPLIFSVSMGIVQSVRFPHSSYNVVNMVRYLYENELLPVVLSAIIINLILSFILVIIFRFIWT